VMILGVGFIMVAGIFPVAIQQARTTSEEGNAAAIARGAVKFIEENLTSDDMPARGVPGRPGQVMSFRDPQTARGGAVTVPIRAPNTETRPNGGIPAKWNQLDQLWNKVRGNLVVANDTRYAWVPLYRRDLLPPAIPGGTPQSSPYAQVFIVVCQVRDELVGPVARSGTNFGPEDLYHTTAPNVSGDQALANLQARPIIVTIDGAHMVTMSGQLADAAAPGSYIIIANDNVNPSSPNAGRMNGRIFRLGNRATAPSPSPRYELMPGNDWIDDPGADGILGNGDDIKSLPSPANAFLVGRTLRNGSGSTREFSGTAQDIAVYTTFIQMK